MTEATLPAWPAPRYETQADAIAAALEMSEPGETVVVHQPGCGMVLDDECSCWPAEITVGTTTDA